MPRLTIVTKGVALAYQKDGLWKTIFPFGGEHDCHRVKFLRQGQEPMELAQPGRRINIRSSGAATVTAAGNEFNNFIDLTDDNYGHTRLAMKDGWEEHAVFLTMENAVLSQEEATQSRWGLMENGEVVRDFAYVGYSGRAVIEAAEIMIDITDVPGYPAVVTGDEEIEIDNTCGQHPFEDNGDLALLYRHIIVDPDEPDRRFIVVRLPEHMPFEITGQGVDNPPEGVEGLPCNKFVASKTDELA